MSFTTASGSVTYEQVNYKVLFHKSIDYTELILVDKTNTIVSAFKTNIDGNFSAFTKTAHEVCNVLLQAISFCTAKNGVPISTPIGSATEHSILKNDNTYLMQLFGNKQVYSAIIHTKKSSINIMYDCKSIIPDNIPYIKLTDSRVRKNNSYTEDGEEYIPVRSVEEIALDKDTAWLANKKYYVVTDDETAEKLFQFLDNYNGPISFDTETTGLRINCFGKINSHYQKELIQYNKEHPDAQIRADKLVGIIFTVEENVSYYFPCANRKFKNLYSDKNSPWRKRNITNTKSRYAIGDLRESFGDMRAYMAETPDDDITCDIILMERVRDILAKKHIVAHHGSFEWKVCWQYEIDCNLTDDTMLLHQILYKFRSTTSNKGEPSNLKYLAKVEFGIDQWELTDFFPTYHEDNGTVRGKKKKKKGAKIDFSYMDLDGARVYAPADGDVTLMLYHKYIKDLYANHSEQEYIYRVEVLVACAIGYMEFYGLRIDESKILGTREGTRTDIIKQESLIRQSVGYSSEKELSLFNQLEEESKRLEASGETDYNRITELAGELKETMDTDEVHPLNISSPNQMATLFYDILKIPMEKDSNGNTLRSVNKKVIKALLQKKDENGNPLYPAVAYYQKFASLNALMTKFFAALPEFMYPGGYVFPSFNQVHTATGRMSCKEPNAQQFPKNITKIIVPRPGFIEVDADYSQIEARVITAIAKNDELAKLFADPDSDYHTLMASLMYEVDYASVTPKMRSDAKSFNFGIPYGMGFASLAILLHGNSSPESQEDARQKYEMYFKNQPNTRKMFADIKEMALVHRYTKTQFNRVRYYSFEKPDGTFDRKLRAAALRQAGNAVIQGCIYGDAWILTREHGIVKIRDVVGKRLVVWNGDKWSLGDITYSGLKQKCIVTFANGQKFICSPIHKFLVRSYTGKDRFIECKDLKGSNVTKHAHRVVVSGYEKSEVKDKSINGLSLDELKERIRDIFSQTGEIKNGVIFVDFDTKWCTEQSCVDLQKALLFFGIRSNYKEASNKIRISIKSADNEKFIKAIGFRRNKRQEALSKAHESDNTLTVKSVEITDEYIDMYDVCNTDGGYYAVDGIITHNTAADIFKISVARNFTYIRNNKLLGLFLIINMIHDEQLMEVNIERLNILRVLADIGKNMQFKLDGYPPLYIGAGVGNAWGIAKGKMNEIHPNLLEQFTKEAENIPIWKEHPDKTSSIDVENYFNRRIYEFRRDKILNYINDSSNWYKEIHPAIGGLINLQFNYGRGDDPKGYKWEDGKEHTESEFLRLNLSDFINEFQDRLVPTNGEVVSADKFRIQTIAENKEDDVEYDDDSEGGFDDLDMTPEEELEEIRKFKLIEENEDSYGVKINDLISAFKICILRKKKVCGLDVRGITRIDNDKLANYLSSKVCDKNTKDSLQVVFLKDGNIINRTGVYVKDVSSIELRRYIKGAS